MVSYMSFSPHLPHTYQSSYHPLNSPEYTSSDNGCLHNSTHVHTSSLENCSFSLCGHHQYYVLMVMLWNGGRYTCDILAIPGVNSKHILSDSWSLLSAGSPWKTVVVKEWLNKIFGREWITLIIFKSIFNMLILWLSIHTGYNTIWQNNNIIITSGKSRVDLVHLTTPYLYLPHILSNVKHQSIKVGFLRISRAIWLIHLIGIYKGLIFILTSVSY